MLHVISIACVSCFTRILRPYWFVVIILSGLFDRIGGVLTDRSDDCRVTGGRTLTTRFLSLDLSRLLVADLDIGEMILIIAINSSCDSIWLALGNTSLIRINKLVLCGIMRVFWIMERVAANLYLTTIYGYYFLGIFTVRGPPPLFRLLSLWFLGKSLLIFKNASWRKDA